MEAKQGRIGLGCVAWSSRRSFLAARSMMKKTNVEPVVAEALAALYATIFSKQMGYHKVIFEGDAQAYTSKYGHFVEEIKLGLRSLESANFIHVKREANNVAHI